MTSQRLAHVAILPIASQADQRLMRERADVVDRLAIIGRRKLVA
jgi:hypothetical protein